jgi:hypothetical protein
MTIITDNVKLLSTQEKIKNTVKGFCQTAGEILCDDSGLEAFEIALGIGIAAVCAVLVLTKGKDLMNNTIFPGTSSKAADIFS